MSRQHPQNFSSPSRPRRGLFILRPAFWIACFNIAFFGFMVFLLWQREVGRNVGANREDLEPCASRSAP